MTVVVTFKEIKIKRNKIFCTTTMFGAFAIIDALKSKEENWTYSTLQEINN